ncbi:epoxide hydrolase 4-like [Xenia sp. Carnegie-2017]|uniref:epoxide hydrolase 4-like n=1 Tax=Xenia sp. Carnegie-2017 TaxID=2897299 RepID=UPI001F03A9DA|nr:epoxide hydrolase 4-like [Xenia sp. Carnegie-2017]XP_046853810.1 epoxide hydrolase 4-like [Xenia sp. Carnegie-2017]
MANSLVKIAGFVLIYSIASFYGLLVSVFLLFKLCQLRGKLFKKTQRKQAPECLQDASFGNHHYVTTKSGHKFHYVAKGDTDKPLMLCLHGFPEFWFSWRFQLKEFSNDYHVVAFDMRGYGDSYSPTGAINYVAQFLVQDIKEVVDALGYSSCILLGHDWGGVSAWSFAMIYPDIVDKLVIVNAPHPLVMRKKNVFLSRKQFFMSWYVFFNCLPYLPEIFFSFNDNCLLTRYILILPGLMK